MSNIILRLQFIVTDNTKDCKLRAIFPCVYSLLLLYRYYMIMYSVYGDRASILEHYIYTAKVRTSL